MDNLLIIAFILVIIMIIMFIPWFIAMIRGIKNTLGIFLLCLFLGWTYVGWVGALIWAVVENPEYDT